MPPKWFRDDTPPSPAPPEEAPSLEDELTAIPFARVSATIVKDDPYAEVFNSLFSSPAAHYYKADSARNKAWAALGASFGSPNSQFSLGSRSKTFDGTASTGSPSPNKKDFNLNDKYNEMQRDWKERMDELASHIVSVSKRENASSNRAKRTAPTDAVEDFADLQRRKARYGTNLGKKFTTMLRSQKEQQRRSTPIASQRRSGLDRTRGSSSDRFKRFLGTPQPQDDFENSQTVGDWRNSSWEIVKQEPMSPWSSDVKKHRNPFLTAGVTPQGSRLREGPAHDSIHEESQNSPLFFRNPRIQSRETNARESAIERHAASRQGTPIPHRQSTPLPRRLQVSLNGAASEARTPPRSSSGLILASHTLPQGNIYARQLRHLGPSADLSAFKAGEDDEQPNALADEETALLQPEEPNQWERLSRERTPAIASLSRERMPSIAPIDSFAADYEEPMPTMADLAADMQQPQIISPRDSRPSTPAHQSLFDRNSQALSRQSSTAESSYTFDFDNSPEELDALDRIASQARAHRVEELIQSEPRVERQSVEPDTFSENGILFVNNESPHPPPVSKRPAKSFYKPSAFGHTDTVSLLTINRKPNTGPSITRTTMENLPRYPSKTKQVENQPNGDKRQRKEGHVQMYPSPPDDKGIGKSMVRSGSGLA